MKRFDGPFGKAEARLTPAILESQQDKAAVAGASRPLEDAAIVTRAEKPSGAGKARGSGARPDNLAQGVRRARPLARRALMILRPLRVAIRARKPWVRARLIRLGWKVRFIDCSPQDPLPRGRDRACALA